MRPAFLFVFGTHLRHLPSRPTDLVERSGGGHYFRRSHAQPSRGERLSREPHLSVPRCSTVWTSLRSLPRQNYGIVFESGKCLFVSGLGSKTISTVPIAGVTSVSRRNRLVWEWISRHPLFPRRTLVSNHSWFPERSGSRSVSRCLFAGRCVHRRRRRYARPADRGRRQR